MTNGLHHGNVVTDDNRDTDTDGERVAGHPAIDQNTDITYRIITKQETK